MTTAQTRGVPELAEAVDVAIVFVSTSSSEGGDRRSLSFDGNADELVPAVAASAKKTLVAAVAPGAVLTPWRGSVDALTLGFMPGQEYANALADILFGDYNPSAKLPLTLPKAENEINLTSTMWPGDVQDGQRTAYYSEKLEVGYRWYHAHGVTPAYAFGHGLSYTTFKLTDLHVSTEARSVDFTVVNTGSTDGSLVVQLYLTFPSSAGEPPKQLKRFKKLALTRGASAKESFVLQDRDLSVWDVLTHDWKKVAGTYEIAVGQASDDTAALIGSLEVSTVVEQA